MRTARCWHRSPMKPTVGPFILTNIRRGARNLLIVNAVVTALGLDLFILYAVMATHRSTSDLVAAVLGGLLLLIGGWNLWRGVRFRRNPGRHPALTQFGRFDSVDAFIREHSPAGPDEPLETFGDLHAGSSLLICRRFLGLEIIKIQDVAWAYKKVTKVKLQHLIPVGTLVEACIHTLSKHYDFLPLDVQDTAERVDMMLQFLAENAPWARIGWDDAFHTRWLRNRDAVVQEIRKRQAATTSSSNPSAA